jgi:hypothetical protein
MDAFTQLSETLAGFGHTLEARTRITFGKDVASALASIKSGGYVVVACKGTEDEYLTQVRKAVTDNAGMVVLIDARDNDYKQVRAARRQLRQVSQDWRIRHSSPQGRGRGCGRIPRSQESRVGCRGNMVPPCNALSTGRGMHGDT